MNDQTKGSTCSTKEKLNMVDHGKVEHVRPQTKLKQTKEHNYEHYDMKNLTSYLMKNDFQISEFEIYPINYPILSTILSKTITGENHEKQPPQNPLDVAIQNSIGMFIANWSKHDTFTWKKNMFMMMKASFKSWVPKSILKAAAHVIQTNVDDYPLQWEKSYKQ